MAQAQSRPIQRLILASESPRRLELLAGIGIKPDTIAPADIDETPHQAERPRCYVERIARQKAIEVALCHQDGLVLAADTVVAAGRRILGKPEDREQAAAFLRLLSGRRHRVLTAVAVCPGTNRAKNMATNSPVVKLVESRVKFCRLSAADIADYLDSDEWQGKAGAYAIQGKAARFIAWMEGSWSGIVGLPLYETANLLAAHGYGLAARGLSR